MKVDRIDFPVVSCGKYMWALGGKNSSLNSLNSTEYYDNITDEWTLSTPMKEKRFYHASVAFRDNILVIGGWNSIDDPLNTAEILDTKLNQFSSLKSMRVPRYSLAATISGNKLYCFNGFTNNDEHSEVRRPVESFNLYTICWHEEDEVDETDLASFIIIISHNFSRVCMETKDI